MALIKRISSRLGVIAAFVATSFVLGLVKLPSPVGSVAFDATPGYFVSAYFDPWSGGIVGALGHLASAASAGFPLGYVHIVISLEMFVCCAIFGLIGQAINKYWGLGLAGIIAVILNGLILPLSIGALNLCSMELAKGIVPLLSLASILNVGVACLGVRLLSRRSPKPDEPTPN